MVILNVVPLIAIPFRHPQTLSYYSPIDLPRGSIAEVSIRNRRILAMVLSSRALSEEKMALRKASFILRPINKIYNAHPIVDEKTITRAKWISEYYWTPLGKALRLIIPAQCLTRTAVPPEQAENALPPSEYKPELLIGPARWMEYKNAIRQAQKAGKSTLIIVPERNNIETIMKEKKDIFPADPIVWGQTKSNADLRRMWHRARNKEIKIILGTRSGIFSPVYNLGLIIVDEEENEQHRSWGTRPHYDARKVAYYRSAQNGARILLGSDLPSVSEWFYAGCPSLNLVSGGMRPSLKTEVVHMRNVRSSDHTSCLSRELEYAVSKLDKKDQMILYSNRRGHATFIYCEKCGYRFFCGKCDAPLVYHATLPGSQKRSHSAMICHHCGWEQEAPKACPRCSSIRIKFFGIGIEKVYSECRKINPYIRTVRIDSDSIASPAIFRKVISAFRAKRIQLIIGTQMLLSAHLPDVDTVGIVSVDTSLHLPDFHQSERVWHSVNTLARAARHKFLIQTYAPDHPLFTALKNRDANIFYQSELDTRKRFSYPPFAHLVKFMYSHQDAVRAKKEAQTTCLLLKDLCSKIPSEERPEIRGPAPSFIPKEHLRYRWHIVLKFPSLLPIPPKHIIERRNALIHALSPYWSIEIDPISLL